MMILVVDSSALISILGVESDNASFAQAIVESDQAIVSAASVHEAFCVAVRGRYEGGPSRLEAMVAKLQLEIVPFDLVQLEAAKMAYQKYGRGTGHHANLNMGDCYAYALAKTRRLPLLFKGNDFSHTDVEPALKPI